MNHLKCVVCRIRVHGYAPPVGNMTELCPVCGKPLEPVERLSELLGFQEHSQDTDLADPSVMATAVAKALAPPTLP